MAASRSASAPRTSRSEGSGSRWYQPNSSEGLPLQIPSQCCRLPVTISSLILIVYNRARLSRSALVITDTELKLIAAAAMIGLSRMPKIG